MRIAIIGAAGNVGSRVVAEALRRGHRVTPLTSHDVDATDTSKVADLIASHDVGVGATRPVPGDEPSALTVTSSLLDAHAAAGVRFVMVGGAGSLLVPDDASRLVADDPRWVPPEFADLARTGNDQLTLCREHGRVGWTYVTPSALMEPGLRTGTYRVGQDELLVDSAGRSYVSMEDMAVAVVDEIEEPAHHRQRFTVASEAS